jgi:hypothetical protein
MDPGPPRGGSPVGRGGRRDPALSTHAAHPSSIRATVKSSSPGVDRRYSRAELGINAAIAAK